MAPVRAASFAVPDQAARIGYSVIFEFVREFRAQEAWRAVPVVVVTAKDLSEEVRDLVIACVARRGPAR